MKERPILFSGPMVKAILGGHKTQTRRVVKPQPDLSILKDCHTPVEFRKNLILGPSHDPPEWGLYALYSKPDSVPIYAYDCPYGQRGDRLWVRETHSIDALPGKQQRVIFKDGSEKFESGVYIHEFCKVDRLKWRPSIFMPRWASRITLEITGVRVERLQEISEDDCQKEGLLLLQGGIRSGFAVLWDSINGKPKKILTPTHKPITILGNSWASNPWVWVIEFKKVEGK